MNNLQLPQKDMEEERAVLESFIKTHIPHFKLKYDKIEYRKSQKPG
ncbi:hypothetical protein QUB70_32425 [Microcoleus sp. A003_D6]